MLPAEIKMIFAGSTAMRTMPLSTTSSKTPVFRTAVKQCYVGVLSAVPNLRASPLMICLRLCAARVRITVAGDAYRARMIPG